MRIAAILLLLLGASLIAVGRHLIRRARKNARLRPQNSKPRTFPFRRLAGWAFTLMGFLAMLLGVTLW